MACGRSTLCLFDGLALLCRLRLRFYKCTTITSTRQRGINVAKELVGCKTKQYIFCIAQLEKELQITNLSKIHVSTHPFFLFTFHFLLGTPKDIRTRKLYVFTVRLQIKAHSKDGQ